MKPVAKEQEQLRNQLQKLSHAVNSHVQDYRHGTFGRVATIIEASVSDPEQRKSLKDLVSEAVYGPSYWNGIRGEFDLISEANGFKLYDDLPGQLVEAKPENPYSK